MRGARIRISTYTGYGGPPPTFTHSPRGIDLPHLVTSAQPPRTHRLFRSTQSQAFPPQAAAEGSHVRLPTAAAACELLPSSPRNSGFGQPAAAASECVLLILAAAASERVLLILAVAASECVLLILAVAASERVSHSSATTERQPPPAPSPFAKAARSQRVRSSSGTNQPGQGDTTGQQSPRADSVEVLDSQGCPHAAQQRQPRAETRRLQKRFPSSSVTARSHHPTAGGRCSCHPNTPIWRQLPTTPNHPPSTLNPAAGRGRAGWKRAPQTIARKSGFVQRNTTVPH